MVSVIRATTTVLVMLAAVVAFAMPADAHAATEHMTSSNWAGYAVSGTGARFRSVAGTWVQPAASCAAGPRRYSAYWVGLGGLHSTSHALEQIGTQVDCSSTGNAVYSAWYELVPAGPVTIHLKVQPGDKLSAKVAVAHGTATLSLANLTRGTHFTARRVLKHIDVSTAEWIVEAPSGCNGTRCHTLPLADFGSASFSGARATNAAGHTGAITDPKWSAKAIALSPAEGGLSTSLAVDGSAAGATPNELSATGDAFTVTYNGGPAPAPAPAPVPAPPAPEPAPSLPIPGAPVPAPSTPVPGAPGTVPLPPVPGLIPLPMTVPPPGAQGGQG
jgi:hypothetical protein